MNECLPIKSIEEINLIKDLYKKKHQIPELVMFTLAINTGIDISGLLKLTVKNVKDKYYLEISPRKTVPVDKETRTLISGLIKDRDASEILFKNRKGKIFDRTTLYSSFKEICSELGLSDFYSVASWRKTFAYHYYKKYKDLSFLMWLFNQHSAEQALKFIGEAENMNLRFRKGVNL